MRTETASRAEKIQTKIAVLKNTQRHLREEGHKSIAAFAKKPDDAFTDTAVEKYHQAAELDSQIVALETALESAEEFDREEQRAAFLSETASKVASVIELAEARIEVAARVDAALADLHDAFVALAKSSNYITAIARDIIRVRDEGLSPERRGEKISFALMHTDVNSPAIQEALAQGVARALPALATSGFVTFGSPIGDPQRADFTLAAAASNAVHGLRQRLLND
jgi:hypothetical protein